MTESCEAVVVELPGYVRGKLAPEGSRSVEKHVLACRACAAELRQVESLEQLLAHSMPTVEVSPTLESEFANRLAAELVAADAPASRSWIERIRWALAVPVAATAALAWVLATSPTGEDPGPIVRAEPEDPPTSVRNDDREMGASATALSEEDVIPAALGGVPEELMREPDFFVDFAVIRDLEVLETNDAMWIDATG